MQVRDSFRKVLVLQNPDHYVAVVAQAVAHLIGFVSVVYDKALIYASTDRAGNLGVEPRDLFRGGLVARADQSNPSLLRFAVSSLAGRSPWVAWISMRHVPLLMGNT